MSAAQNTRVAGAAELLAEGLPSDSQAPAEWGIGGSTAQELWDQAVAESNYMGASSLMRDVQHDMPHDAIAIERARGRADRGLDLLGARIEVRMVAERAAAEQRGDEAAVLALDDDLLEFASERGEILDERSTRRALTAAEAEEARERSIGLFGPREPWEVQVPSIEPVKPVIVPHGTAPSTVTVSGLSGGMSL